MTTVLDVPIITEDPELEDLDREDAECEVGEKRRIFSFGFTKMRVCQRPAVFRARLACTYCRSPAIWMLCRRHNELVRTGQIGCGLCVTGALEVLEYL